MSTGSSGASAASSSSGRENGGRVGAAATPAVLLFAITCEIRNMNTASRPARTAIPIAPMAIIHINSEDAASLGISDGDDVVLKTRRGEINSRSQVDSKIKKGVVFVPFHYADAPANRLTNPARDPQAKIPEFKACAVNISKA